MKIGINVKLGVIAGLIICIAWYAFAKSLGFYAVEVYIYRNYVSLAVLILGILSVQAQDFGLEKPARNMLDSIKKIKGARPEDRKALAE